jgi:TldD protein
MLDVLQRCVEYGEKQGAQFVEARYDDLTLRTLVRINETWKEIQVKSRKGVGIACYQDGASGYSYTASDKKGDLEECAKRALKIAKVSARAVTLRLDFDRKRPTASQELDSFVLREHPQKKELNFKTDLVNRIVASAQEFGKNVRNITGSYGELYGKKLFTNSEGSKIDWGFEVVDLRVSLTSKTDTGDLVSASEGYGGTMGLEVFNEEETTPEVMGEEAGRRVTEQLEARACPGGVFRALIENRLAGVLAHESFGHLSEADFVVTGESPLTGKMGTRLGTEHATIVDTGTPDIQKFGGLWVPYDDQGVKGGKTVVLNKGVLSYYLHNRGTAQYLHQEPTGNCRAVHFGFQPIPRMTNTYFEAGDLTEEEALEKLGTGVYALQSAGGQVQGNGSFLFKAIRGYWVEKGEKMYPLREVALSGNILDFLSNVEGGTRDLSLSSGYFGGCGKGGQYPLPVGLGGPKLLVGAVVFGGKAEQKEH